MPRYIKIPHAAVLKSRPAMPGETEHPTYSFSDFLKNQILADGRWYSDLEWESALDEMEKFVGAKVGDIIEVSEKGFEKMELAARAVNIAGDIKVEMRWLVRAFTQADKIDPRPKSEKAAS